MQRLRWVLIRAGCVVGSNLSARREHARSGRYKRGTVAPLLITLTSMWVLEVPAAFVLSRFTPLGQYGIPIAIGLAMLVRMPLYTAYYRTGRWTRVQVL